ncbi:MAG: TIGR01548 family HAD-type hydrolase [Cyanobacteria bacterium J06628_6]
MPKAIAIFDIDGVVRDVGGSYRRALADTVEQFTGQLSAVAYRPAPADIDRLKSEGCWNNDWEASQELIYRHLESQGQPREQVTLDYDRLVDFFQQRYRGQGDDPTQWDGYITQEPLLMTAAYLEKLTHAGILWAFFSGATRGSAHYILQQRMGLSQPPLVAMEDAPGKPDPTGLLQAVQMVSSAPLPVIYAGDTVADMETVMRAKTQFPERQWLAVGVLPPHAQLDPTYRNTYTQMLMQTGADTVLATVEELDAARVRALL